MGWDGEEGAEFVEMSGKSLSEVHGSVPVIRQGSFWRRLLTFSGPAFMVSVGYMDPGNWATDIAAGAQFGYRLLWVILLSNLMAILFQTLAARLGIVSGRDLAQACRDHYPRPVAWMLWILCEIAIVACDLAEVLGSALALHLLFGLPLVWGVLITAFDVMLLLALMSFGIRRMEALIVTLVGTIGVCFALEMIFSNPPLGAVAAGFVPVLPGGALYLAIGIVGATVMPHNLYLHSALVQSRAVERTPAGLAQAAKFNFIDSVVALNGAFFVNAAILILAAVAFHATGNTGVASIEDAHQLLAPLLGTVVAPLVFAVALLAAGQSSTITGTFAGQIVMEGFIGVRLPSWLRRLVTRLLAIIPAVGIIWLQGDAGVNTLLILSQVVLSLQLPFALIPLLHFTGNSRKMGAFASPGWLKILAWTGALIVLGLNGKLVFDTAAEGLAAGGSAAAWVRFALLPAMGILVPLLGWMAYQAVTGTRREMVAPAVAQPALAPAGTAPVPVAPAGIYRRIGVALEVRPERDGQILDGILPLARSSGAEVVLLHAVESAAAKFIGDTVHDEEARGDAAYLMDLAARISAGGIPARTRIGAGRAEDVLVRLAEEENLDLLVTGGHGHRLIQDIFLGSPSVGVRHRLRIPVMAVPVDVRRKRM
ncbi:MAG: Nramp family divalent metal transporter [Planctomycetota bacterium]